MNSKEKLICILQMMSLRNIPLLIPNQNKIEL